MSDSKYCEVPGCKEDIIDRINKAVGVLHTKINAIAKTKISRGATYATATLSVAVILGVSTILYASYASGRDKRTEMIQENTQKINNISNQQTEIKTKLNVELEYIKKALEENKELSEDVLKAIQQRNGNVYTGSGSN